MGEWGVDLEQWGKAADAARGGLRPRTQANPARQVTLLQRKTTKHGANLGKTTGWIHRASLKHRGVEFLGGVSYDRVDDAGLHIRVDDETRVLEVDHVVVCAGQVKEDGLADPLRAAGFEVHVIGGAALASELDAKRAIRDGAEVAAKL